MNTLTITQVQTAPAANGWVFSDTGVIYMDAVHTPAGVVAVSRKTGQLVRAVPTGRKQVNGCVRARIEFAADVDGDLVFTRHHSIGGRMPVSLLVD